MPTKSYQDFCPKYPLINFQGRSLGNFWLAFWEKWWPHKFILNLTDLYIVIWISFYTYSSGTVKVGSRAANNLLVSRVNDNPLTEYYLFPQNLIDGPHGMNLCHRLRFHLNSERSYSILLSFDFRKTMYNLLELYSTMPVTKTVQRQSLTPVR